MKPMFRYAAAIAAVSALCLSPALAAEGDGAKSPTPEKSTARERQQDKMKRCNAEAGQKALKGDERRAFMSACLKG
jgi:psiF repeat